MVIFVKFYAGKPHGIPSPISQNEKNIDVLKSLFEKDLVDSSKRLGFKVKSIIFNVILISKNARITRPKKDIKELMKIDYFMNFYMMIIKEKQHSVI